MANYYPLIAKAVAGLENNTGESRRILYERARNALMTQLRSVTPPLSESDITRERLALEEGIRKVEADVARRARAGTAPGRSERPLGMAPAWPGDEVLAPKSGSAEMEGQARPEAPPQAPQGPSIFAGVEPHRGPERLAPPQRTPPNWGRSLTACMDELSRYLSGWMAYFRVCTAEAASGFRAIDAHTRRRLRAIIIHQRKRPRFLYRHLKAPLRSPQPQAVEGVATHPPSGDTDRSEPPVRDAPVRRSAPWPAGSAEPSLAARREAGMGSQPLGGERGEHGSMPNEKGRPPLHGGEEEKIASDHAFVSGADQGEEPRGLVANSLQALAALASNRLVVIAASAALIVLALSGLAYWQWPTIAELFGGGGAATTTVAPGTSPSSHAKITDRIGPPTSPSARPQAGPAVAQRVVLYEEDPSNASGKQYVGTAIWRTELVAAGPGQANDVAVRAEIEIPEPKVTVKWSLRRNTDKALPASHTIEIMFSLPPDSPNGGISNIAGILMKQAEQTRGMPLAGLAVKVMTGFFLIGLSPAQADVQRNVQLLKERAWFNVPVVYANGRRAIMAIEKGEPGERAFAEAFAAWGE